MAIDRNKAGPIHPIFLSSSGGHDQRRDTIRHTAGELDLVSFTRAY